MKKLYLDMCVLKGPFDRLNTSRLQLEADAASLLIRKVEEGNYKIISSEVLLYENGKNRNKMRRESVALLLSAAGVATVSQKVIAMAALLEKNGFQAIDALHIAVAENEGADFITCDHSIMGQWKRTKEKYKISIRVMDLLDFVSNMED